PARHGRPLGRRRSGSGRIGRPRLGKEDTMASPSLEERMTALEAEVTRIKQTVAAQELQPPIPWWDRIFGTFANSEDYDEAMRLGREYRASLRPQDEDEG